MATTAARTDGGTTDRKEVAPADSTAWGLTPGSLEAAEQLVVRSRLRAPRLVLKARPVLSRLINPRLALKYRDTLIKNKAGH